MEHHIGTFFHQDGYMKIMINFPKGNRVHPSGLTGVNKGNNIIMLGKSSAKSRFYFGHRHGLFVGPLFQNAFHKHYAFQISVSTQAPLQLTLAGNIQHQGDAFFISSNRAHQLTCESTHLTLLIHPLSVLGYYLQHHLTLGTLFPKERVWLVDLKSLLLDLENERIDFPQFCQRLDDRLRAWEQQLSPDEGTMDARIYKVIHYLEQHPDILFSLEQIADLCHLSPSRFLHLFKEKTGVPFRRYQLCNRLMASLPSLQTLPITEVAHAFSFSDAAHYNRTFKETFGVTPKFLQ
jgi:AraC-like DNA-binding protein